MKPLIAVFIPALGLTLPWAHLPAVRVQVAQAPPASEADHLPELSQPEALRLLPPSMAKLAPKVETMFRRVNRKARAQGFEGWPDTLIPDEGQTPEPSTLGNLHPTLRRIWANSRVLWVHISDSRWDALLLMKLQQGDPESPWRLVWLRDAFGETALTKAHQTDTWGENNALEWEEVSRIWAKDAKDLRRSWDYSDRPKKLEFICCPPESDAGENLVFDPSLGPGVLISGIDQSGENDGDMTWVLKPEEAQTASVIRVDPKYAWVLVHGTQARIDLSTWNRWKRSRRTRKHP